MRPVATHPRPVCLAALGATLLALAGCDGREFAEVEGVVTLNGQPLPDAEVVFLPDPERGNPGPRAGGYTDPCGYYRVHVERPPKEGTVLGPHRVCIIDIAALPGPGQRPVTRRGSAPGGPKALLRMDPGASAVGRPKVSRVPPEYNTGARTPIRDVEIKPGKQTLDFDVKTAQK
jgi:hypothetical protein